MKEFMLSCTSLLKRVKRHVLFTIMGWTSALLSRLVPNGEMFYEGMESRIYDDTYEKLKERDHLYRQLWMSERRPLLWKALGEQRAEQMLSRIERRIEWEQALLLEP